jgi:hypothetical protein
MRLVRRAWFAQGVGTSTVPTPFFVGLNRNTTSPPTVKTLSAKRAEAELREDAQVLTAVRPAVGTTWVFRP